jgi:3-methyladenine DNA glycosylase/8-oxoguanine DNA glycosylase
LVQRFGESLEHEGRRRHAFPAARVIAEAHVDDIRQCGLSLRKVETLRRIAGQIETGEVSEERLSRMSSPEAIRRLTELGGIGPWSAGLILLRGLGRLDVFPAGDVGVARALRQYSRLPPGRALERLVQRFGDHRGYLYFCLLGRYLLNKGLIRPAPQPQEVGQVHKHVS